MPADDIPKRKRAPGKPKAPSKLKTRAKPAPRDEPVEPATAKAAPKPRAPRKPRATASGVVDADTTPPPKAPANPKAPRKQRAASKRKPAAAPSRWQPTRENQRILCLGGALAAIAFLLGMYWLCTVDYPYYDQWDFVPLLEKAYEGGLARADFWAQHNEHRLVFPRLLMLALAWLSDWNIYWELAANFVLAALTWIVLCAHARAVVAQADRGANEAIYLLFTLIVFSLSQWQNWFLGWQLQEFMNVLAVVITFIALGWRGLPGAGVGVALFFATISTFSFANGILVWPVGLILLIAQRKERRAYAREELIVWGLAGAAVIAAYLHDYQTPAYHPPLASALAQPLHCTLYVLAYLGQPVWNLDPIISIVMGLAGLLLWGVTLVQLMLSRVSVRSLAPWIGLALYAIGTACLTALGRVDNGLDQAMSSRYVTMANLLWIPVVLQFHWVARISNDPLVRRSLPWKTGVVCALLIIASLTGAYRWTERYNTYIALRGDVMSGVDLKRLGMVYPPDPQVIVGRRDVLQRLGLGIFKPPTAPDSAHSGP